MFGPRDSRPVADCRTWMTGQFSLKVGLDSTWNRLWIVVFAILTCFAALQPMCSTARRWGLQMRAVTQNRRMASAMGIRTPFVDAMTFGLGSGVAGLAGVALTQIDNVSDRNLGQGYIVDSFMVVVFGGVGNLWGTLIGAAFSIGMTNKFLEPYVGARARQDHDPGAHHPVHPAAAAWAVRPQGPGKSSNDLRDDLSRALDGKAVWLISALLLVALAIPFANMVLPDGNPLHLPNYAVPLFGKYMTYAMLALALDAVSGAIAAFSRWATRRVLLARRLRHGDVPDAPDRRSAASTAIRSSPTSWYFLNYKELPLVLERLRQFLVHHA